MGNIAKDVRVYVDQYNLSSAFKTLKPQGQCDPQDSTTFGAAAAHTFLSGLKRGQVSLEGLFAFDNVLQNQIDNVLQAALPNGVPHVFTGAPLSDVLGNRAIMLNANETKYDVSSIIGQIIMAAAELQGTGGYDGGIFLHALGAETATGNSASQDNGAASSNGGVAHLHVTAISGATPSGTIKVQHSSDNVTFVDLVTFNAATVATSQRVELPAGTTVNRFLRESRIISGTTPSFNFAVAFARR